MCIDDVCAFWTDIQIIKGVNKLPRKASKGASGLTKYTQGCRFVPAGEELLPEHARTGIRTHTGVRGNRHTFKKD